MSISWSPNSSLKLDIGGIMEWRVLEEWGEVVVLRVGETVMLIAAMLVMVVTGALVKALKTITDFRLSAHRALTAHLTRLMPRCWSMKSQLSFQKEVPVFRKANGSLRTWMSMGTLGEELKKAVDIATNQKIKKLKLPGLLFCFCFFFFWIGKASRQEQKSACALVLKNWTCRKLPKQHFPPLYALG